MSADNWGICPKCKKDGFPTETTNTLREDYEQGMDEDGEYYVHYRCNCRECNFWWEYEYKEQVVKP